MSESLILSIFPGADLLGRGFEQEGFCVVRGPDLVWGGDILQFHPPPGTFSGIIGGPPCQDFSKANRSEPSGNGLAMLQQFCRIVHEARPSWWLLENVPQVPTIEMSGYQLQRFNLNAAECGGRQRRLRAFQFGSCDGSCLVIRRGATAAGCDRTCMATEFAQRSGRRGFGDFCELQGLPRDFDLPGLSLAAKYRAVGNGVPVFMAATIARAIESRKAWLQIPLCQCGCGRPLTGNQLAAGPACRKRLERSRKGIGSAMVRLTG